MQNKNYTITQIKQYITGEDVTGYTIEELEDDYHFMQLVIMYTNDKKMYDMCSDKVKSTYNFITFIINKFKNDQDFICKVADEYFNTTKDEIERIELLILMNKLIDKEKKHYLRYSLLLESIHQVNIINIELTKKDLTNKKLLDYIEYGFILILNEYYSSNIVMNFFATKYIYDIIETKNINLEEKIHNDFTTYQELETFGINNYLLELIFTYDTNLANYLGCHIELLSNLKKELLRIKHRWNFYLEEEENQKYYDIITKVHNYMEEHEFECYITEFEILYYIASELGILKQLAQYEGLDDSFYEEIISFLKEDSMITIAKKTNNLTILKHYYYLKQLITNILNSKEIPKSKKLIPQGRIINFNSPKNLDT